MADYVDDNLELSGWPWVDGGLTPAKEFVARDVNQIRDYMTSLKTKLRMKPVIDLQREGVVVNDSTKGAANVALINSLIVANSGTFTTLLLPYGVVTIDRATYNSGHHAGIYFGPGTSNISLVGRGPTGSILELSGVSDGRDLYSMQFDQVSNCHAANFGIRQGTIQIPSSGQHDHLIMVSNLGSAGAICEKVTLDTIRFGKALGDCLTFFGDTQPVIDCAFSNLFIDGKGIVQQAWAPNTNYALNAQVTNGGIAYVCTTAGRSASSGGPTGTSGSIADGTVVWSGNTSGITYRTAARSGISFQRGYNNLSFRGIFIRGIENSCWDMESTGDGTLQSLTLDGFKFDNTPANGANTANACSFSGSVSHTSNSKYLTIRNGEVRNGCVQLTDTSKAHVQNVLVWADQAFAADPSTALFYTQNSNDGLQVEGLTLRRIGTCGAGDCLNIQGTGALTFSRLEIEQGTNGYPIYMEPGAAGLKPHFVNRPYVSFSGSTPTTYDAINVTALAGNVDNLEVDGLKVACSTGALRSAVGIATRNTSKSRYHKIVNCTADDGAVTYGVYVSKIAGSTVELAPIIQGCSFGSTATLLRTVDQSDNPITGPSAPYAIVGGNKNGGRVMRGTDTPLGNVKAPVGTIYIWENGNSTQKFLKTAGGGGYSGWSLVTVGAAGTAPLIWPADATAWTAHIADNQLTAGGVPLTAPSFGWGFQDVSGNAAAAEGATALTVSGSPTFQQTEPGYTRKFIVLPDGGGVGFSTSAAALPAPSTSSYLMAVIGRLRAAPTANGTLFLMSSDTTSQVRIQSTGKARVFLGGNDVQSASAMDTTGVHIWLSQVDVTNHVARFSTEDQIVLPGWVAPPAAGKLLAIGGFDAGAVPFALGGGVLFTGAMAEMTFAEYRNFNNSFGGSAAW